MSGPPLQFILGFQFDPHPRQNQHLYNWELVYRGTMQSCPWSKTDYTGNSCFWIHVVHEDLRIVLQLRSTQFMLCGNHHPNAGPKYGGNKLFIPLTNSSSTTSVSEQLLKDYFFDHPNCTIDMDVPHSGRDCGHPSLKNWQTRFPNSFSEPIEALSLPVRTSSSQDLAEAPGTMPKEVPGEACQFRSTLWLQAPTMGWHVGGCWGAWPPGIHKGQPFPFHPFWVEAALASPKQLIFWIFWPIAKTGWATVRPIWDAPSYI